MDITRSQQFQDTPGSAFGKPKQVGIYAIGNVNSGIYNATFSCFAPHRRDFTDVRFDGREEKMGAGHDLPHLIRTMYGITDITPTPVNFSPGFMTRDNKVREIQFARTDPFIFSSNTAPIQFRDRVLQLHSLLHTRAKELGLPLKTDKDRQLNVVDTEAVWHALQEGKLKLDDPVTYADIQFVIANEDILKKAALMRAVPQGWHITSYSGNAVKAISHVKLALTVLERYVDWIHTHDKQGHIARTRELYRQAGDPLDTNPGYPYYTVEMSKDNVPITRVRIVKAAKDLIPRVRRVVADIRRSPGYRTTATEPNLTWQTTLAVIDDIFGSQSLPGHPLAAAPLRRIMYGYKWAHMFTQTATGLVTAFDQRGMNSVRVAWMVPWLYNLIIAELHCYLKAFRLSLPGCYHSGDIKRKRAAWMQKAHGVNQLFIAEADYSNYDKNIPVELVLEITRIFFKHHPDSNYANDALAYLHKQCSIIWPDYPGSGSAKGYAFRPQLTGLLSGVKVTSETGTYVNFIINLQALITAEGWDEHRALNYLLEHHKAGQGALFERFHVASDDTAIIAPSVPALVRQSAEFEKLANTLGLKGEIILSDRFLMRHTMRGGDSAVPMRVFQNTISNETPADDYLVFLVGLASRTDSLFDLKSVDPFGTSSARQMTPFTRKFTLAMLESMRDQLRSAAHVHVDAIQFLTTLIEYGMNPSSHNAAKVHNLRRRAAAALATREAAKGSTALNGSWLYQLYKDSASPSQALILTQLEGLDPSVSKLIADWGDKEHQFFLWAQKELGCFNTYGSY